MKIYAKDLDDQRVLVNERDEGPAVHNCVDSQTGLGTKRPRPFCENIAWKTTVSHRAEKKRLLDNFIM